MRLEGVPGCAGICQGGRCGDVLSQLACEGACEAGQSDRDLPHLEQHCNWPIWLTHLG